MQRVNQKYQIVFQVGNRRYIILMGGRGAGRSTVSSQYALAKLRAPDYFRCAIMRFAASDIRNSIYQEILDRIDEQDLGDDPDLVVREHLLTFGYRKNVINGIGFRKSSGDQKGKLKSLANYTDVIIEEADEVAEEDFIQLDDSLRSIKSPIRIFLLLNPPDKNHWIIKRFFNLIDAARIEPAAEGFFIPQLKEAAKEDTVFVHTTYLDNRQNIAEATARNFERYRETRPDHYFNMIKGWVSAGKRGRIFKDWKPTTNAIYDKLPFPEIYGLDFGFSNDPAALIGTKRHNLKLWAREYIYETGLTNKALSDKMENLGIPKSAIIYADSQEPKSIEELRGYGWDVRPASKGEDSVRAGIDMLLNYETFYTEESTNVATENQEYKWALDRNKEPTNNPIDKFNHGMDAIRYAVWTDEHQGFVGFA